MYWNAEKAFEKNSTLMHSNTIQQTDIRREFSFPKIYSKRIEMWNAKC